MNEEIAKLKILSSASNALFKVRKSNASRITKSKVFSDMGKEYLLDVAVEPINIAISELSGQIERAINFIPIYNAYLCKIDGLNMFDSAELITELRDVSYYETEKNLLSYAGLTPNNNNFNKKLNKTCLKIAYKLAENNKFYKNKYDTAYLKYKTRGDYNGEKHLEFLAKRVVAKEFLKSVYRAWRDLNKD